jgi:glycosyltransferase involved in cell wall biosynthesis
VVREGDVDAWQRALAALLGDPPRRAALRARGLERVAERFALPVTARQHLDFFAGLCGVA